MKNLTKFMMLGLLLVPFAAAINLGNVYAEKFTVAFLAGAAFAGCEAEDKCLDPSTITVPVGATVVWVNKDSAGHTVTSGNPGDADSGSLFDSTKDPTIGFLLKPEATWEHIFDEAGDFPYFCQVHPWNIGKVIVGGEAPAPMPEPAPAPEPTPAPAPSPNALVLTTDNGSMDVEVTIDKGTVADSSITVDPPQEVKFEIKFIDLATRDLLQHVNYEFHVADESGAMVAHKTGLHVHDGIDSQSVAFSNTGSFTLMIVVEGTGLSKPYDTMHSGTASSMVTVVPEFPLSVMAIMAAVVGIGVATTRFRSLLKLQ